MTTTIPDNLVYSKLTTLFDSSVVGVGPMVYHSPGGDPTPPYVVYRRTGSETERDLAGNAALERVEYEVEISSMFYNQVAFDFSALDNWTSGSWYFNLTGQVIDTEEFSITYTMEAVAAIN